MNEKLLSFAEVLQNITSLTPAERDRLEILINKIPEKTLRDLITFYQGARNEIEKTEGIASKRWHVADKTIQALVFTATVMTIKERLVWQYQDEKLMKEMLLKRVAILENQLLKFMPLQEIIAAEAAAEFQTVMRGKIIQGEKSIFEGEE
jgi:hypothetical protein